MINLKDFSYEELKSWFLQIGEPSFRADQVFDWMNKGAENFDEMTNLSKQLREKLKAEAELNALQIVKLQVSKADGTRKYLFETLGDGAANDEKTDRFTVEIESVFMKYRHGNTICVSSQAGCRMGCSFCASGLAGLERNLTTAEMTDQFLLTQKEADAAINHIVIMGIGEPLENYDNVKKFIGNLKVSRRNITLSTCGLIPEMIRFGDEMPQVNLAVSLHAPNDELRSALMPVNKKYPINDLMKTVSEHIKKTGRRVTFEYALINGINDSPRTIDELIRLVRGMNVHINLIPLNEVEELGIQRSDRSRCVEILQKLEDAGIQATLRRELGQDIDAACGQLRMRAD